MSIINRFELLRKIGKTNQIKSKCWVLECASIKPSKDKAPNVFVTVKIDYQREQIGNVIEGKNRMMNVDELPIEKKHYNDRTGVKEGINLAPKWNARCTKH